MSSLSTDDTLKRLVDLTEVEHRVLKGHAAKAGLSMRDLVSQGASSSGTTTTSIQSDEANAEEAEAASE